MKTTIKLEGKKEIRDALEQALMLNSLESYAGRVSAFYRRKVRDILLAMGDDQAQTEVYKKYGDTLVDLPSDKYLVLAAFDNYETARALNDSLANGWRVNSMIADLTQNPIIVECADGDDPDDIAEAWLKINTMVWERFSNDIAKELYAIWQGSAGFDDREEYGDLLDLYLGEDRR